MRTEKEIMDLILNAARGDERIRAAYLNGSRANPNVPRDRYQDYDLVYVVTETQSFLDHKEWINAFGEIAIFQEPDLNDIGMGEEHDFTRSYGWLMLFKDGNRIDLHIETKEETLKGFNDDGMTLVLLDKDDYLPLVPPPTDKHFWVKKPTELQYASCCNEFWWCLNNVAKGIARDELPYAMWMYNVIVRDMLVWMLEWYIGVNTDFAVSAGKQGKYFKKYLPQGLYDMYAGTYSDSDYNHLWDAIFTACALFRTVAPAVGEHFGYLYNRSEDENMTEYLNRVKTDSLQEAGR